MNRVGNIFLVWRKGPGERRIAVGKIRRNSSDGVRFEYLQDKVVEAKALGFVEYTGFPDIEKKYTQNVLEIFSQRLSRSERNDLGDFYDFWDVDRTKVDDPYYMLAQTQGLLPIDNFEFLADFNPIKGLVFVTEIAGLSKRGIDPDVIKIGDRLIYELDKENEHDRYAVIVKARGVELGYVKSIHSKVFHRAKSHLEIEVKHIEKNGKLKRVFIEVRL